MLLELPPNQNGYLAEVVLFDLFDSWSGFVADAAETAVLGAILEGERESSEPDAVSSRIGDEDEGRKAN